MSPTIKRHLSKNFVALIRLVTKKASHFKAQFLCLNGIYIFFNNRNIIKNFSFIGNYLFNIYYLIYKQSSISINLKLLPNRIYC